MVGLRYAVRRWRVRRQLNDPRRADPTWAPKGAHRVPGTNEVVLNKDCPLVRGRPCAKCDRFPEGYGAQSIPWVTGDRQIADEWHP